MSDLQNCYSDEDVSTVQWCFSSFITLPLSLLAIYGRRETYEKILILATASVNYVTQKQLLAHVSIIINAPASIVLTAVCAFHCHKLHMILLK